MRVQVFSHKERTKNAGGKNRKNRFCSRIHNLISHELISLRPFVAKSVWLYLSAGIGAMSAGGIGTSGALNGWTRNQTVPSLPS